MVSLKDALHVVVEFFNFPQEPEIVKCELSGWTVTHTNISQYDSYTIEI